MKKRWIALVLLLFLAVAGYWFATVPASPVPAGSASAARLQPGLYAVVVDDFHAEDASRATPPNRDISGHPGRVLDGEIWRPQSPAQPGPLVVYSHGFMSYHREGVYLAQFLASRGYTVIAVDYPLTGMAGPGDPLVTDVVNQPGDISFLIDTLLARNSDPQDVLHGSIDPGRIAAVGVSLGGLTTTLVSFHPRLKDPRIRAAVSIAGPTTLLAPAFFTDMQLPYLMLYGDADVIVPYADNALPVLQERPGTLLVTLKNASHAGFAQPAATIMRFVANPDTVGCRAVSSGLAEEMAGDTAALIAALGDASDGINIHAELRVCTDPPPPTSMPAARQHMFTTLAVSAFLDSVFAADAPAREAANQFLRQTLGVENAGELSVTTTTGQ
ncbi:hypothetical protein E4634_01395 [Mangrovimicrobium sediminis]|uniref:PET hydrolase/cutinase-like domain-containing protein n=1 Tax=Mangrovimicrobium sediminis TaxID=2562682 RepID=A0A4Z0MA04_9GAMM|nr:hypothetical protein [Haliea sp. SAOS-164]TGD76227.1 hypothetical protein E4634_01395 [Haliea sp. SAOS-164]